MTFVFWLHYRLNPNVAFSVEPWAAEGPQPPPVALAQPAANTGSRLARPASARPRIHTVPGMSPPEPDVGAARHCRRPAQSGAAVAPVATAPGHQEARGGRRQTGDGQGRRVGVDQGGSGLPDGKEQRVE
jgi:hypothetical protein